MFLEKAIENWLTKTNEIGYQLPFCQALLGEGFSICHISKHNAFEQGKDIIALDSYGDAHVFQLKKGNITSAKWRNEVKAEIEELIDLTIVHPSVNKNRKHTSYLVTNGYLEDTVRLTIDNLNAGKWKDNPLRVIVGGELLQKFLKVSRDFVPQEISDYRSFLDQYFADGRELVNESRFSKFIVEVLQLGNTNLRPEERKRNIAAAILYTSYVIGPFKAEQNYVSIMQTLGLLAAHILALAERYNLDERYWKSSFDLVWAEIKNNGTALEQQIDAGGLVDMVNSWWDGEVGPFRRHIAVSYLFAFKLAQIIEGDPDGQTINADRFFAKLRGALNVWGETSFIAYILLFEYVKKSRPQDGDENIQLLIGALLGIIMGNGRKSVGVLPSPYYTATTILKARFNQLDAPIEETFRCRSSLIKPIIDLLTRQDRRAELEQLWREITYLSQERFVPQENWQNYLWRCAEGEGKTYSEFPNQTQSWEELVKDAAKVDDDLIPPALQGHPYFLPLFLLVYPHRANANFVKFLDVLVD
jgi:hypothetical protein